MTGVCVGKEEHQCQARATHCNFFPQVSADDSAEEADHIETNGAASVCSAAIFSPYVFAENGQLVHVKSQWCP